MKKRYLLIIPVVLLLAVASICLLLFALFYGAKEHMYSKEDFFRLNTESISMHNDTSGLIV